jgi:hypothetical protein
MERIIFPLLLPPLSFEVLGTVEDIEEWKNARVCRCLSASIPDITIPKKQLSSSIEPPRANSCALLIPALS